MTTTARVKKRHEMFDAEYAIFFDIDGCFHKMCSAQFDMRGDLLDSSDPLFVWADAFVEAIRPYHNVALVCHSMWRNITNLGTIYRCLPPLMQERFLDATSGNDRHDSIVSFAKAFEFKDYIIVDDDSTEFPKKIDNLVLCDSRTGLSCSAVIADLKHQLEKRFGPPPPPIED